MLWEVGVTLLRAIAGPRLSAWIPAPETPVVLQIVQQAIVFAEHWTMAEMDARREPQRPQMSLRVVEVLRQEDPCSICLETYSTQKCVRTECRHIFHESCLNQWLERSSVCPLCRNTL